MSDLVDPSLLAPSGELAPSWPPAVRDELTRRREALVSTGCGVGVRVLDLAEPAAMARVLDAGRGVGSSVGAGPGGRVDVILSVAALVAVPDLPLALRGIARLLEPDGRLRFVEPVSRPGLAGMLAATAGAALPAVRGQHLGRDLLFALRAAGLLVTDLERFTMPTLLWPLRSFVDGSARPSGSAVRR
jgi:SAM-dependent methyltransferase